MFVFGPEKIIASRCVIFRISFKWVYYVLFRVSKLVLYFANKQHVKLVASLLLLRFLLLLLVCNQLVRVELNLVVYKNNAVWFACKGLRTNHGHLGNVHFAHGYQYLKGLFLHSWMVFILRTIFRCYLRSNKHSIVHFAIVIELILSVRFSYLCLEKHSTVKHALLLNLIDLAFDFFRAQRSVKWTVNHWFVSYVAFNNFTLLVRT